LLDLFMCKVISAETDVKLITLHKISNRKIDN